MANENIEETIVIKRTESIASRDSSFYTLSNRLILPMFFISIITIVPLSIIPSIITLCLIVLDFVIRYPLSTTLKDAIKTIWLRFFGTKRKSIKN